MATQDTLDKIEGSENLNSNTDNEDSDDEVEVEQMSEPHIVKLKEGLAPLDLQKEEGAMIEIDTDDLHDQNECDSYDPIQHQSESFKYSKYELLGLASDDEEGDDDEFKPFLTPFEKMANEMVDITKETNGGILKRIIKNGESHLVPENATVIVHYNGYTEFNDSPFDSTHLRGKKANFRLNNGSVIHGLDLGIATMRRGEKSHFLIKPEYAYGPLGCAPRIPPNATVFFEVELVKYIDDGDLAQYQKMSPDEQVQTDFETLMKVCMADHQLGNDYYKKNILDKACIRYEHATNLLETCMIKNEDEQFRMEKLQLKLFLNLALIKCKQGNLRRAVTYSKRALRIDKHNVKALYRLGCCLKSLGDFEDAKRTLLKAKQMEPTNTEIIEELAKLNKRMRDYHHEERELYARMLSTSLDEKPKKFSIENQKSGSILQAVSEDFKSLVDKELAELIVTDDQKEMVFPEGFTLQEQSYIAAAAKLLGLNVLLEKRGGHIHTKVCK